MKTRQRRFHFVEVEGGPALCRSVLDPELWIKLELPPRVKPWSATCRRCLKIAFARYAALAEDRARYEDEAPRIHLRGNGASPGASLCGLVWIEPERFTYTVEKVTCRSCLRKLNQWHCGAVS